MLCWQSCDICFLMILYCNTGFFKNSNTWKSSCKNIIKLLHVKKYHTAVSLAYSFLIFFDFAGGLDTTVFFGRPKPGLLEGVICSVNLGNKVLFKKNIYRYVDLDFRAK